MNKASESIAKNKKMLVTIVILIVTIAFIVGGIILFTRMDAANKAEAAAKAAAEDEAQRLAIIESATFHKGISISGVDVSGMTMDEARAALAPIEDALYASIGFTLSGAEGTHIISNNAFDVVFNTEEILEDAMLLAREGSLTDLQAELNKLESIGRRYNIVYNITGHTLQEEIAAFAAKIDIEAINATFNVRQIDFNDVTNALNAVNLNYVEDGEYESIYDMRFEFTEGIDGLGLNQQALLEELEARIRIRNFGEVAYELETTYPTVTVATLREGLTLRASAKASYKSGNYKRDTRVHNMTKACGLMYGTVLQPGDIFSCNTILGDRYEKYGWQMAPAVIEGGANTEDQPGGGVCQVSSVIYNAVLKSDLKIEYRQAHSSKLSYVPGGLDATINTRTIDFTWSNNTDAPIFVFTWVDAKKMDIVCEIYGLPFPEEFDEIALISEELEPIPVTENEYIENASLVYPYWMLKNEAKKGYVFQTYASYLKNGVEVRREEIALTTYKMHPNRYYVWPGYNGEQLVTQYKITPQPATTP